MRRTTSAWMAGVLGAGLTATMVLAQQLPPAGGTPRSGSAGSGPAATDVSSLYGTGSTRGARYLLRNGLDYLQYQQYDRALKFLREAEAREKELSEAEKLALKQGIERAQSGLRTASDAEAPYARSERSRRGKGFTAARAEPQLAARTDPFVATVRAPDRTARSGSGSGSANDLAGGDPEGPGEPIRLVQATAGSETRPKPAVPPIARDDQAGPGSPSPLPGPATTAQETGAGAAPATLRADAPEPIPAFVPPGEPPARPPDLPSFPGATGDSGTRPDPVQAPESAPAPPPLVPSTGAPASPAPSQEPQPGTGVVPKAGAPSPSPSPAQSAPAPILLETPTPAPSAPAPAAEPPAPAAEPPAPAAEPPAPAAGVVPATIPAPSSSGPAAPTAEAPAAATTGPGADDPAITALPTLPGDLQRADGPGGPAHRESEEPAAPSASPLPSAPASDPNTPGAAPSPAPTAVLSAEPVASPGIDGLPPLPADLGRNPDGATPSNRAAESSAAAPIATAPPGDATAQAIPGGSGPTHAEDEPLPGTPIGNSAPSIPAAPATGMADPAPTATAPVDGSGSAPALPGAGSSTRAADEEVAGSAARRSAGPQSGLVDPAPGDPRDAGSTVGASSTPTGGQLPPISPAGTAAEPVPVNPAASASDHETGPKPGPDRRPDQTAPGAGFAPGAGAPPPSATTRMATAERFPGDSLFPAPPTPVSTLAPELRRRVEEVARNQEREDELRLHSQVRPQPDRLPRDTTPSNLQTQTQLDISRAPSPAEARPIKAIPVPEDWVPLAARSWSPQSKYWAAAATCHLPLYFQDPVLERYGHPVEQFVGPYGRYLSYPVDDPKQSTQRNQIIQPFFSWGLFALQIASLPYNLIMDPPWEAQYDLGYYRPGDMVPNDIYWLPLHGYGPPLRGNHY